MALIDCPDCRKPVSDAAAACIHRGAPLRAARSPAVVTTQATGKAHKLIQLAGAALAYVGIVMIANTGSIGAWLVTFAGVGVFIAGRATGWWGHG